MADGPVLQDPGVLARQLMGDGNPNPGQPKKNDILEDSSTFLERIFGLKLTGMGGLFSTGIFTQLTPPQQAFLGKSINQGAATLTARGGAATNFAMESLRIATLNKFDKLVKPQIDGLPVQPMSLASLGTLTPLNTGGSTASRQMDIG